MARIRRPQGRRGEVAVELFTDFPERFQPGLAVSLWRDGRDRREAKIEDAWPHKGGWILKLAGVDSINDAGQLSGWEIQIVREDRRALEGGQVYVSDLVGCRVVDQSGEQSTDLGTIAGVDHRAGTPVLVVDTPQGELLIPFAEEICRVVDTARGVVEVELPEGLRDLNR